METFCRWHLSSRQESLMQLFTEKQQWLLYGPVSSVMTDIFWTCITFQNRVFFKRGAQLFILAWKCVYVYEILTQSWMWQRWRSWCQLYSHTQCERKDKVFALRVFPQNAQETPRIYLRDTPGFHLTVSHVFSQGSALALKMFTIMLLFLMLIPD